MVEIFNTDPGQTSDDRISYLVGVLVQVAVFCDKKVASEQMIARGHLVALANIVRAAVNRQEFRVETLTRNMLAIVHRETNSVQGLSHAHAIQRLDRIRKNLTALMAEASGRGSISRRDVR